MIADDMAEKVIRLIENPAEADRFGANARQLAVSKYDWSVLVRTLEDFYHGIVDKARRAPALRYGKP